MMEQFKILTEIVKERYRQDQLHTDNSKEDYLSILIEEVGEVGKAIQLKDMDNLQEELIQVAAVCVRWIETL